MNKEKQETKDLKKEFATDVISKFQANEGDISERNNKIEEIDGYVYGDSLRRRVNVPLGHDFTEVNWVRRTVEIHRSMFMSRGFMITSTYDSQDISNASPEDVSRLEVENDKSKKYAEARKQIIDSIIKDNGGFSLWGMLAESAGVAGDAAVKTYYDKDLDKFVISPIEAIENVRVIWSNNDLRERQATGFVYQITKQDAIRMYGISEDAPTTPLGKPLDYPDPSATVTSGLGQEMVTVIEVTGKFDGWGTDNKKLKEVSVGKENEFNAIIVGNEVVRIIDNKEKMPKYYIFPNKRMRNRPWGLSDITEAAVQINATYIETLSDWRTVAAGVNFPKYKAYGFGRDTTLPKSERRKIQMLPLSDGQDIVELRQGDANQVDFKSQMDELKEQFVRETGISRVLFDDPSVTFNSNQALLTSLKPTSDIAESKKQIWQPILIELFTDALETIAANKPEVKEIIPEDENWSLAIQWPSVLQKEDPQYQSMLLNRFNAGLMSVQSYMEAQGDTSEEIDRIKDEVRDPVSSAILGRQLPAIAQVMVNASTAELQAWYQASLPQQESQGGNMEGVNSNGGTAMVNPTQGQVEGGMGTQPVSQPGTGATSTSVQGALAQTAQNGGA